MRTREKVLFIAGMHRSGTSAFAGSCMMLGGARPRAMIEAGRSNPKGHFEPVSVIAANEALLASLHRVWFDFRPMPTLDAARQNVIVGEFARILQNDFEGEGIRILKDPRISLLIAQWVPAAERAGADALFVMLLRDPAASASSIVRRDKLLFDDALAIWLRYMLDAERGTRGLPRAIVEAEQFLGDPVRTLTEVANALKFDWPRSPISAREELEAFVEKDLFHPASQEASGLLTLAREAYALLLTPDRSQKFAELDRIQGEFNAQTPALYDDMVLRELQVGIPARWDLDDIRARLNETHERAEQAESTASNLREEIRNLREEIRRTTERAETAEKALRATIDARLRRRLRKLRILRRDPSPNR